MPRGESDAGKGSSALLGGAPAARLTRSLRDFEVLTPEEMLSRRGIAVGKPVKASSSVTVDGTTYPASNAVDGLSETRWSSEFSDPQWLSIDLGKTNQISRVELEWEGACAKAYAIQLSLDGATWTDVFTTDKGKGGKEVVRFKPTAARFVRFSGTQRATRYGYSLWEFRIFEK